MTAATRQALERVAGILEEAGWDRPPSADDGRSDRSGGPLTRDHFDLLVAELAALRSRLGLNTDDFKRVVSEAVGAQ